MATSMATLSGMTIATDQWDDETVRVEAGHWTTACRDCAGTGWFDGTHPGEDPWGFPDVACKGTGRAIITLASLGASA